MDIYRKLQQQLDTYSFGFPATESGIEINILKDLFTDDDVNLFLQLTPRLETPDEIAARNGSDPAPLAVHLEDMAGRGLLFRLKKSGAVKYGAIPFMHGIFEYQVKRINRSLSEKMEIYFNEGYHEAIGNIDGLFLRTVPVNESIKTEQKIASYEDAREILKSMETIVVTECICRKEKKAVDKGCGRPLETCFMFGSMAKYYLDNKMGRQITADEGIEILTKAQRAGLVTQPSTSQNPNGMCCCCGDCCGVLLSLKKFPEPAKLVFSNHFAEVSADECTSCGSCVDMCPMDAISMNGESIAEINLKRCIGCGVCVISCPVEAISLKTKPEAEIRVPPENAAVQMITLAKHRGVI